jgi:hypothetical protein
MSVQSPFRVSLDRTGRSGQPVDVRWPPLERCTTLVPIPSFRPILRMPSPFALNSSIRASTEGLTRRRPNFVPFALARAGTASATAPFLI